jgi:hypothetical protein
MLRALSIDIGWKHLAYAMLEVGSMNENCTDEEFSIKAWNCESLLEGHVNVNDTSLDELIRLTVPSIAKILKKWIAWPGQPSIMPTIAFLEQQPLGMQARNVKSKTLSHVIQGLLISQGISVVFISPQKKLKYMEHSGNYSDNKKYAIEETLRLLKLIDVNESNNQWLIHFNSFKKKDDLADSFLQGLYASKEYILSQIKQIKQEAKEEAKQSKLKLKTSKRLLKELNQTDEPAKSLKKKKKLNKSRLAAESSVSLDLLTF